MKIEEFEHVSSAFGNAFFSGLHIEDIWEAVKKSQTCEEFEERIRLRVQQKDLIEASLCSDKQQHQRKK